MSIIKLDQNLDPTFSRATTANYKDLSATAAASGVIRYENVNDPIVIDTKREWDRGTHSGTQATYNFLTANQSNVETDTTGFTSMTSATLTRDTGEYWQGSASLKVVTPGGGSAEGMAVYVDYTELKPSTTYTLSAYVKGSAALRLFMHQLSPSTTIGTTIYFVASGTWTRVYSTFTTPSTLVATSYGLRIDTSSTQASTFYVDGLQIEEANAPSPWIVGRTSELSLGLTPIFDRGSSGTIDGVAYAQGNPRFNAGILENGATNYLLQSNTFNTSWTQDKATATIDAGITDPFGGNNAWKLVEDSTASASHRIYSTAAGAYTYGMSTLSVYLKAGTRTWAFVQLNGGGGHWFNLGSGTLGTSTASTGAIESVGNGWYRCSLATTTRGNGTYIINIAAADLIASYSGDGASYIYVYGAQIESNPAATTYIPTTTTIVTRATTYSTSGIFIEEGSTNTAQMSEQFNHAGWLKDAGAATGSVSVVADSIIAPDGTMTADKIVEDSTASSLHQLYKNSIFTASSAATLSVYAKAGTRSWIVLLMDSGNTSFDLTNGVVGTTPGGVTASMKYVGNGWYRCSVSKTSVSITQCGIRMANGDNSIIYNGDGSSYLYLWGAQAEVKAYPTSYMPTPTTANVSRSTETLKIKNSYSLVSAGSGTIVMRAYVDGDLAKSGGSTDRHILINTGGSNAFQIQTFNAATTTYRAQVVGTSTSNAQYNTNLSRGWHGFALRYNPSELSLWIDGVKVVSTALSSFSLNTSLLGDIEIGWATGLTGRWNAPIDNLAFFNSSLSDADLLSYTQSSGYVAANRSDRTWYSDFNNSLGYAASGVYTSEWYNIGTSGAVISSASGVVTTPSGTNQLIEYRTSDSDTQATTSSWSSSATENSGKYIQYRRTFYTDGSTINLPYSTSTTIIPTSLGKAATIEESTVNLLTSPTSPATQDVTVTANGDYALSFVGTDAASGTVTIEHKLLETTTADFGTGTLVGTTASSNALTLSLEADPTFTRATAASQRDGTSVSSGNARYEDCIKQILMTTQGDFDACTKTGPIHTSPAGTATFGAIIDGFDADTSWAYTGTTATGTITPTFNTASSRLELVTSTSSSYGAYIYNNFVASDTSVEAVCSQSFGGGMILRYADVNNYYLLYIADDTTSAGTNLQIFKNVAGVFTQLGGTINLTFTRGTQYTFRFEIVGSQLSAYQDGVLKLTVNDTALSAAGKVGLYTNSTATASYFHSFTIDPVTPLFARNSVAYGRDGVSVVAGQPRYTRGKNLMTANQSNAETNTTGTTALGSTVTRDTAEFYAGVASFKIVTNNAAADEGVMLTVNDASVINKYVQTQHVGSCYIKGSGTIALWVRVHYQNGASTDGTSTNITATSSWVRYSATVTPSSGSIVKYLEIHARTITQQSSTFYIDNVQLELGSTATTWEVGGDNAILSEEGATNLLAANTDNFNTNWSGYNGSSGTITTTQSDPFGGTSAYRVQTTGGSSTLKWYAGYGPGTNGLKYSHCIWIKNNDASNAMTVKSNMGSMSTTVNNSDGWVLVKQENITSDGVGIQHIQFQSAAAGTNVDVTCMWPQIEQNSYCTSYIAPGSTRSQEDFKLSKYPFVDPAQGSIFFMAYWDGDLDAATCLGTHNLMCFDGPSSGGNLLRIVRASTYLDFRTANNAGSTTTVSWSNPHTTLAVGWHMFGVRWSSSRVSLYVDGVERAYTTSSINIPSIAPNRYLDIGGAGTTSGSQQWNYPIDGISFFSTSLTDAEMVAYSQIT